MTASELHSAEEVHTRPRAVGHEPAHIAADNARGPETLRVGNSAALLRHRSINSRSNSGTHAAAMQALQRTYGNRAVQRYALGSNTPYRGPSIPVQREEGGMWDFAKKLIGADQIGPGIEKILGKGKSAYEWAEKGILDFLGGGGKGAGKGASEPAPSADDSIHYLPLEMEDVMITSFQL